MNTTKAILKQGYPQLFIFLLSLLLLVVPFACQPIISLGKDSSNQELKKIKVLPTIKKGDFKILKLFRLTVATVVTSRV